MAMPVQAFVGLGSNLDDPAGQVRRAFDALAHLPRTRCLRRSALYRSLPLGRQDQPHYVNAVAELATRLDPHCLLASLLDIERRHGRVRSGERWGPRVLDLDLLLYGDRVMAGPDLILPHPGLSQREFVLYPLYEIAPRLEIPGLGPVAALRARCPERGLHRMNPGHDFAQTS